MVNQEFITLNLFSNDSFKISKLFLTKIHQNLEKINSLSLIHVVVAMGAYAMLVSAKTSQIEGKMLGTLRAWLSTGRAWISAWEGGVCLAWS